MKSTIIIPAYNHPDLTIECVKSVIQYTPSNASILIFDDYSDEKNLNYLVKNCPKDSSYRKIDILRSSSNNGFAKACNEAAQYVERLSSILIFLNNDTVVTQTWYQPLVNNLKNTVLTKRTTTSTMRFHIKNREVNYELLAFDFR